MIKLKMGSKGEIVIPKKIREHLGLSREHPVLLEVKEKSIELKASSQDIVRQWESRAKKYNADVSKWVYGDDLYGDVF